MNSTLISADRAGKPDLPHAAADRPSGQIFEHWQRYLAVAVGFSISLSTSMGELLVGAYAVCWLLSGDCRRTWRLMSANRVLWLPVAVFGGLVLGMTYTSASSHESWKYLLKYREFLYIPLFASVFTDPELRRKGRFGFLAGAVILLGLSYFEFATGFDLSFPSDTDYVTFKDRIIHNLLMGFLVYLLADELRRRPTWRWGILAVIGLTLINMTVMVQGRTGYLVLGSLTVLYMYQQFQLRGIVYATALLGGLMAVAYPTIGVVRSRIDDTVMQLRNQFGSEQKRSLDARLEFYAASCHLIGQHPWFGTGTGSYPAEYKKLSRTRDLPPSVDPHCEYLLLAVQMGLVGLSLFLATLAVQWRATHHLAGEDRYWSQGMLVTVAVGSLFNSLLLGFTGGLFYGYMVGLVFGGLVSPDEAAAGETPSAAIFGITGHSADGGTIADGTIATHSNAAPNSNAA